MGQNYFLSKRSTVDLEIFNARAISLTVTN